MKNHPLPIPARDATHAPPEIPKAEAADTANTNAHQALLQSATTLVRTEMDSVNHIIAQRSASNIPLIRTLGAHIIQSGGKRLRPLILLLSAKASGYVGADNTDADADADTRAYPHHIILAAVIEFIHTATLLHDDVVDRSLMRRGRATANSVWGNEASVLVGDFLYSRAFEMMLETDNTEAMQILAATTNAIAEGEVMQLLNTHSPTISEQAYREVIHRKTARLFASAAQLGGVLSGQSAKARAALADYGLHLGTAFQLIDDLFDYRADDRTLGKNVGDDLAEGKPTLPLIHALKHGNRQQQHAVRQAIIHGEREKFAEILAIVESTGALSYTAEQAKLAAHAAIDALAAIGESPYKNALINLAQYSIQRDH